MNSRLNLPASPAALFKHVSAHVACKIDEHRRAEVRTPSAWISPLCRATATLKIVEIITAIAECVRLPNMNQIAGRPEKMYGSRHDGSLILPSTSLMWKGCICVHEHAPAGLFSACAVHVKARGGREREGNNRVQTRIMQPSGSAAHLEAVVKPFFFPQELPELLAKSSRLFLKLQWIFFQGSKWIQSL